VATRKKGVAIRLSKMAERVGRDKRILEKMKRKNRENKRGNK
jgi:hypothetical protein